MVRDNYLEDLSFIMHKKKVRKIVGPRTKSSGRRSKADMRLDVLSRDGVFLNWKDKIE